MVLLLTSVDWMLDLPNKAWQWHKPSRRKAQAKRGSSQSADNRKCSWDHEDQGCLVDYQAFDFSAWDSITLEIACQTQAWWIWPDFSYRFRWNSHGFLKPKNWPNQPRGSCRCYWGLEIRITVNCPQRWWTYIRLKCGSNTDALGKAMLRYERGKTSPPRCNLRRPSKIISNG